MGVSLYYTAYRDRGLDAREQALVERIAEDANRRLAEALTERLPHWHRSGEVPPSLTDVSELYEGLHLYGPAHLNPGELLSGASKLSHLDCGLDPMFVQLEHLADALAQMRRSLPGARWRVHVDDADLPWNGKHYDLW